MTANTTNGKLSASLGYIARRLSVIPIKAGKKYPTVAWQMWQRSRPTPWQARQWWERSRDALGIVAGKVSGNLLIIDHESLAVYNAWLELIPAQCLDNCPIASSPRGGRHVYLRLDHAPPGNEKLALNAAGETLIETRGEGGQCVAPPAEGREWVQRGWLDGSPVEPMSRELLGELLNAARFLDEQTKIEDERPASPGMFIGPASGGTSDGVRPGDDYNARTDADGIAALLEQHGWTRANTRGGTIYVTRPGKDSGHGISGTIGYRRTQAGYPLFITFSTNAAPFEATTKDRPRGYTAFSVYALLNHGGDFSAAARVLGERGYGSQCRTGTSGGTSSSASSGSTASSGTGAPGDEEPIWTPRPVTLAEMAVKDYRHRWRIRKLLVADEPGLIFGPPKILKTSLVCDMTVAIATGGLALGEFRVDDPARVLFISGESGEAALWSIFRRICSARAIDPASVGDVLSVECSIPPLWHPEARAILADLIRARRANLVIIDPAYLTLLQGAADEAKNMFAMGPMLGRLTTTCREAGAQLLLIHHCNSSIRIGEAPELSHIAFAGFAQFARQWIGINRETEYDHNGKHDLIVVAGGSAGHGGRWSVAVDEGIMEDDFSGRIWDVSVTSATQARKSRQAEKDAEKERERRDRESKDEQAVLSAIDHLATISDPPIPATTTRIRSSSGIPRERTDAALARLRAANLVEMIPCKQRGGSSETYRRKV